MSLLEQWRELVAAKKAAKWEDKEREWEETILNAMKNALEDSDQGSTHTLKIKTESEPEADHLVRWCRESQGLRASAWESSMWEKDEYPYYVQINWNDDD